MKQNKFSNETPEQVILIPRPRTIRINPTIPQRAYGLFDSETGTQVSDFVKGNDGQIEFSRLEPNRNYDVGIIGNPGDEKPQFVINWTLHMRDDTDTILDNSDDFPVVFPYQYVIKYKGSNNGGVYDLADDKGETVGQVIKLAPTGDKPEFYCIHSFKMVDDTKK